MELDTVIKNRRSVRQFADKAVKKEDIFLWLRKVSSF